MNESVELKNKGQRVNPKVWIGEKELSTVIEGLNQAIEGKQPIGNYLTKHQTIKAGDYIDVDEDEDGITIHGEPYNYLITEDDVEVELDATKGVAPYSTSYGYTNVTITNEAIRPVNGGIYFFEIEEKLVVTSAYRNVRVRFGEDGEWIMIAGAGNTVLAGSSYFIVGTTRLFVYKASKGVMCMLPDSDTTYPYLLNTIAANAFKADDKGASPRYAFIFPTTPCMSEDETWSALVLTSSTATTKKYTTCDKYYVWTAPIYQNGATYTAGQAIASTSYQYSQGQDLRYSVNLSSANTGTLNRLFIWLKGYDTSDMSFVNSLDNRQIVGQSKIASLYDENDADENGDLYFYFIGFNTTTYYSLNPDQINNNRVFKFNVNDASWTVVR